MKIALLGDIALFGHCTTESYFRKIGEYLSGFDYVVGNLETPFSAEKRTFGAKSAYICAEPKFVKLLKTIHVDAVALSNNHMFDYGREGYELTKKLLEENDIKWFGCEGREVKIQTDGNKIVFSGYCCFSSNPLMCVHNGGYGVNAYDISAVRKRMKDNYENGYLNILAVHAGAEHVNYPSIDHIRAARKLSDVCHYVYYGHHPHVVQGVEEYNGSLIAHSLGNFCFDDVYTTASKQKPLVEQSMNNRTGMILEIEIAGNKIKSWKERLIYIDKEKGIALKENNIEIEKYNEELIQCEENKKYIEQRQQIIEGRLSERKAQRDLIWFLKRLRPRYLRLIMDMRRNNQQYRKCVSNYL